MNFVFVLVALSWSTSVLAQDLGDDWKIHISNLKSELKIVSGRLDDEQSKVELLTSRLENKETELNLLKTRVETLEIKGGDSSQESKTASMKEIDNVNGNKPETPANSKNKTLEERVETLEELSKIKTLRSCYEYSMYGITTSGLYDIDPDGDLIGYEPFKVFCDFDDGTTQILHDQDFTVEIPPCPEPMCYQLNISYFAPMEQITALKDLSETCYQDITFDCFLSGLAANDDPIGVWLNKDGGEEIYFVGANHGTHMCSCGLSQNCSDSEHNFVCNCDASQIPLVQQDQGTITNSTSLPILGFKYGDMKYQSQFAAITIGRLKCKGQKHIEPDKVMDSCANLKTNGVTQSGHYILNDQSVAFCEMSRQINDPAIEQHVGRLHYNDVVFLAVSNRDCREDCPDGWITFDVMEVDTSGNFNKDTGSFIAPTDGTYLFLFNADVYTSTGARISVYVNGVSKLHFHASDEDGGTDARQLVSFWSLILKQGDEVRLKNEYESSIYISVDNPLYFLGFRLN